MILWLWWGPLWPPLWPHLSCLPIRPDPFFRGPIFGAICPLCSRKTQGQPWGGPHWVMLNRPRSYKTLDVKKAKGQSPGLWDGSFSPIGEGKIGDAHVSC